MNPLCMWTQFLKGLGPEEMIETFARTGWDNVELSNEHGKTLLERDNPAREAEAFRRFAAEHGIAIPQGHLWLTADPAAVNQDETLDILKRWIDLFLGIGVRRLVIHPGGKERKALEQSPEQILEAQTRAFSILAEHMNGADAWLCLENVNSTPLASDLLQILRSVGRPQLAICLDTGHLNMAKASYVDFIRETGALLKALHIADNEGERDQHMMPFGRGSINWEAFYPTLLEIGFDGPLNFEIPGENLCPIEARLLKLDYLRNVAPILFRGWNP